jgi:hypothetical protein
MEFYLLLKTEYKMKRFLNKSLLIGSLELPGYRYPAIERDFIF